MLKENVSFDIIGDRKPAILFDMKEVLFLIVENVGLIELYEDNEIKNHISSLKNDESIIQIVVPDIHMSKGFFKLLGYYEESNSHDAINKVNISTLKSDNGEVLELIKPLEQSIPEFYFLKANGPQVYKFFVKTPNAKELESQLGSESLKYTTVQDRVKSRTHNLPKLLKAEV
jgi:hypothetical protein